jgi:hypothetical protein
MFNKQKNFPNNIEFNLTNMSQNMSRHLKMLMPQIW